MNCIPNTLSEQRTILFVDDETKILHSLKRELADSPHRLIFVESSKQALVRLANTPIHIIVTDIHMPEMSGDELLSIVKEKYPNIVRIVLSGYSDGDTLLKAINRGEIFRFIQKPWDDSEELIATLEQAIDYFNLHDDRQQLIQKLEDSHKELEQIVQERTRELHILNEQLKSHYKMKDEFVITVTHELRTPLSIIRNIISNATSGTLGRLNRKLKKNMEIAEENISRLANIISDFIDISRIISGELTLNKSNVSIASIVNQAVSAIQYKADCAHVRINVTVPDNEIMIYADSAKIVQALENLLSNAVKFSPDDQGCIQVSVLDKDQKVYVEVEDNGPGIPPEDIDKIFNRFVQVKKQIGPGAHGTGLGLAIAKELLEIHQGYIWAENSDTGGARFSFALPIHSNNPCSEDSSDDCQKSASFNYNEGVVT